MAIAGTDIRVQSVASAFTPTRLSVTNSADTCFIVVLLQAIPHDETDEITRRLPSRGQLDRAAVDPPREWLSDEPWEIRRRGI
jgi:hypothetical protein